jgi:hypothetical protein
MSDAREIVARALEEIDFNAISSADAAPFVLSALTAAGFRILAPGQIDEYTRERCAEILKEAGYFYVPTFDESEILDQQIEHGIANIRALTDEVKR